MWNYIVDLDYYVFNVVIRWTFAMGLWTPKEIRFEIRRMIAVANSLQDSTDQITRSSWLDRQTAKVKKRKRRYNHFKRKIMAMTAVESPLHIHESTNSEGERIYSNRASFDTDSCQVGIDNRASACISHRIKDFVGPLVKVNRSIKGFGGERVMNVYQGTIVWKWQDNDGRLHRFRIPNSYYVPKGNCRLLSPQHWAKSQLGRGVSSITQYGIGETTTFDKCVLFWDRKKYSLDVPLGRTDNVATFYLAPGFKRFDLFCQECNFDYDKSEEEPIIISPAGVVSDNEEDDDDDDDVLPPDPPPTTATTFWSRLTTKFRRPNHKAKAPQTQAREAAFDLDGPTTDGAPKPAVIAEEEEKQPTTDSQQLLRLHHQMGHISFAKLQSMAKQNIIPRRLANADIPRCTACCFAKATRRQWREKRRKHWTKERTVTRPGEVISVDQLVSPSPGLIAQISGTLTKKRYKYATVYVDQYSGLSFVYLQKTATADETIEGKKAFEAYCKQHGVRVQHYHADNGIFRAHKWVDECRKMEQGLSFAGVNAHHSNGLAERRIRSLQDLARSMLIHQHRRWSMAGTVHLWPYALRMANDAINESPNLKDKQGRSPLQLFSNSQVQLNEKHWVPFGCPVYVLNTALQSGKGIHNKWEYRSKVGIYLGRSPNHGRNIALVLDRTTGLVSPQFHVIFDRRFQTVKEDKFDTQWQRKAGLVQHDKPDNSKRKQASTMESVDPKTQEVLPVSEGVQPPKKKARMDDEVSKPEKHTQFEMPTPDGLDNGLQPSPSNDSQMDEPTNNNDPPSNPGAVSDADTGRPSIFEEEKEKERVPESQRDPKSAQHPHPAEDIIKAMKAELSRATVHDVEGEIFCLQAMFPNYAGEMEQDPLSIYKATSDPDTMYMHEAMREKDAHEFKKAMKKEWEDQINNGNFSVVHRSQVPEGGTILPAVWQMKRKRDIKTRTIKKYKARLNIDGSKMQYGKHYDQTYAPVASWNSIRTLLVLSALLGWHTRQIDYVLAFPQAPVEREIYMKIPGGFEVSKGNTKDYVLKLHRNVYGGKQSSRVFFKFLSRKLIDEVGFKQSEVDECVFYRGSVMYVLYTDDSLLAGPDLKEVEQAIEDIKAAKLDITIEGDIQDFLGVNIERKEDGTIHLTQPHLIDQILEDLRLEDNAKPRSIPAPSSKLLSRHSDSPDFDGSFNYRSVIGKLNYLEKGSRSDIAYITHQCARFSSCPKKEHGEAIRWLGRYLKGTKDKGTILKPDKEKGIEVYVDADFAGNWDPNEYEDRDTARSRHGYYITYAGCPIVWKSQMQTEVALSSTESEYTGLSYALREAIPIMNLFQEMIDNGIPLETSKAKVHCKVFEDNSGALEIAKVHKFRPRTKHLNNRLHHFRSYIGDGPCMISIHKIHTLDQIADILTKPLNEASFVKFRKLVLGW
ncbi:unnamed protein product [Cylindrotheca closterium]|uniref:Integrase catalytic domain-containing protein n=2 Tax=Cylindrotheca closterium TaxID=2856 RepID=A0AAD2G7A2_9STRA|nr:unnamed protein product [Cylindrotheca closterium]CAJ1965624.1 unnamed protein product [Cylindrotheca closterium]